MKKILFLVILILAIVSCGTPKEIVFPNKNLKLENGVIIYKGKPYTGKLKANLTNAQGIQGVLSLKDGHFEGLSEIKSEKQKMHVKFTVTNGKFEGELLYKTQIKGERILNFKEGKMLSEKSKLPSGVEVDFTYTPEGVINGTMKKNGQIYNFKDGEARFRKVKIKSKIDYQRQVLVTTLTEGVTVVQKSEYPLISVSMYEKLFFPAIVK